MFSTRTRSLPSAGNPRPGNHPGRSGFYAGGNKAQAESAGPHPILFFCVTDWEMDWGTLALLSPCCLELPAAELLAGWAANEVARLGVFLHPRCERAQRLLEGLDVSLAGVVIRIRDRDLVAREGDPMSLHQVAGPRTEDVRAGLQQVLALSPLAESGHKGEYWWPLAPSRRRAP